MLTLALAIAALALSTPSHAQDAPADGATAGKRLQFDSIPFAIQLPAGDALEAESDPDSSVPFEVSHGGELPIIAYHWVPSWQPDLARLDLEAFNTFANVELATDAMPFRDLTWSHREHEALGHLVVGSPATKVTSPRWDLDLRLAVFAVKGGFGVVAVGTEWVEPEGVPAGGVPAAGVPAAGVPAEGGRRPVDDALDAALAMVELTAPPLTDLPTGHYVAEAGYALDLPEHWRALTNDEMVLLSADPVREGHYSGKRAHTVFLDPSRVDADTDYFSCSAFAYDKLPPEVLSDDQSPIHARNFRTISRVVVRGGSFTSGDTKMELARPRIEGGDSVKIDKDVAGVLTVEELPDRPAYRWLVDATRTEEPVKVGVFYTAYGAVGLSCVVAAPEGHEGRLAAFESATQSLRITDGEENPMHMTVTTQYKRWWPYRHPLLQLYWLPIPLFLLAIWAATRK